MQKQNLNLERTSITTLQYPPSTRKSNKDWNLEWKRIFVQTKIGTNKLELKQKVENIELKLEQ